MPNQRCGNPGIASRSRRMSCRCAVVGPARGLPAMAADRAWAGVEVGIEIRTIP
jgi:hypothetical protein